MIRKRTVPEQPDPTLNKRAGDPSSSKGEGRKGLSTVRDRSDCDAISGASTPYSRAKKGNRPEKGCHLRKNHKRTKGDTQSIDKQGITIPGKAEAWEVSGPSTRKKLLRKT